MKIKRLIVSKSESRSRCSPFARPHSVYKWSGIERRGKKTRDGDRKDGSPRIQPTNDAFLLAARVQWLTFRKAYHCQSWKDLHFGRRAK
ncbi:hypothetical protein TNIN_221231 [Trichonephila inaurata madagascariensis]|uniref:Uncharacterized protein n=1 Tax=Trichonephila inaurata madagascariensis TaxID=2747483 RepID=A0A8X6IHK5_9ARAC|nr:hypothetical protein TNIN_221231 [Trichonephila inaurata madagascariensis]